jgi:hypothetical protein
MADPVLDEDRILNKLAMPSKFENLGLIQEGAIQALVDLYDRGVTREEYLTLASSCVSLYAQTAKFYVIASMNDLFCDGTLDKTAFDNALKSLSAVIDAQRETVIGTVCRLKMCPSSAEKIH